MSTPQPLIYLAGEYSDDAAPLQAPVVVTDPVPAGAALLALGGAGSAAAPWPVLQQVTDNRGNGWAVHATTPGGNRVSALASCRVTEPLLPGDQVTGVAAAAPFTRWQLLAVVPPPGWVLQPAAGSVQTGGATAAAVSLPALGPAGANGALGVAVFIQAGAAVFSANSWPLFATTSTTPTLRSFTTAAAPGAAVPAFTGTLAAAAAHSLIGLRLDFAPWPVLAVTGPHALPAAEVGVPYAGPPVTAEGGWPPYAVAASGVPPGVALAGGHLAGTPTEAGGFEVTFTVADSAGATATLTLPLTVAEPSEPPEPPPLLPGWTGPRERLPAEWTFWADTIVGASPLGPLDPVAFTFQRLLCGHGRGEITLPVEQAALDQATLLRLWYYRIWAYYGGVPVWCGVPTGIADSGGSTTSLTLTELTGYLEARQWDEVAPRRFDQVEQTVIALTIAEPVTDVGVDIVTAAGPGALRDRTYTYLELSRAELLYNLSQVGQAENQAAGPQFRTEYWQDAATGRPRCRLRIAYPRVGGQLGLGLTVPGDATAYGARWDADQLRTRTFAAGELPENAAENAARPVFMVDRPQAGLPRLDRVDDYPGVSLISTLRERANTAAVQYASPVLDLSAAGRVSEPPVSSYAPGDSVTIRVVSPLLPGGIELAGQLTAVDVNAAESSAGWTVATVLPAPRPRATLTERLDRIDLTIAAAFRARLTPAT
jgi:hypothetical protein